jgi:anti-anti-sigma factor
MNMDVIETDSGITHVVLDGRFDIAGAQAVDLRFNALAGSSKKKIIVDLAKVSFIASMGVRTLMLGAKAALRRGAAMVVCGAEEHIEEVLRATGFDEVVHIYPDYRTAVVALSS